MTPPEDKESRHIDVSLLCMRCVLDPTMEPLDVKINRRLAVRITVRRHDSVRVTHGAQFGIWSIDLENPIRI